MPRPLAPALAVVLPIACGWACRRTATVTEGDAGDSGVARVRAITSPVPTVSASAPILGGLPQPVGGPWVTCYGMYRPTSTAERDVTRLGALCGPVNGMHLLEPTLRGEASRDVVAQHAFRAAAGDCFRILVVAEAAVPDLAVEVRGVRRELVAADNNNDRWPILNPDGPFCVTEAGPYTVSVQARTGKGPFALQIWKLP